MNNDFWSQQSLQIATRENNEDLTTNSEPSPYQHVSDNISEDSEGFLIKGRYTSIRDLKAVSQTQIGESSQGVGTRSSFKMEPNMALLSEIELDYIDKALQDQIWIEAMQEELNQFEKSKVWILVPLPKGYFVIGTRWVLRNKLDESGKVVRKKTRLVTQGYNQ